MRDAIDQHVQDRRGQRWPWLAAAALVLGLLTWAISGRGEDDPRDGLVLGPEENIEGMVPKGEVESWDVFAWETPTAALGGSYTITIWRAEDSTDTEPFHVEPRIMLESQDEVVTWTPPAELLAKLPIAIRWRVEAISAFNAPEGRAETKAWLR